MAASKDRLYGVLDLLVLTALGSSGRPLHGYDITEHVRRTSNEVLQMEEGSLYPALHRMEETGWVRSEWDVSDNNRRARYYSITAKGRRHLRELQARWTTHVEAVTRVLRHA